MVTTRGKRISYVPSDDFGLDSDDQSAGERTENTPTVTWLDASSNQFSAPSGSNQRIKKKRKSMYEDDDESVVRTKRARARKSSGREKSTFAQGQAFGALPVEIFLEVCRSVTPLDLLNMSRLSKRFRSVLMSKNSRRIWEDARASVTDLPERPPDLSEPDTVTYDIIKNGWPSIPQRLLDIMPSYSCRPFWRSDQGQTLYIRRLVEDTQHSLEREEIGSQVYESTLEEACVSLQKLSEMLSKTGKEMEMWSRNQAKAKRDENLTVGNERFRSIQQRVVAAGWKSGDVPARWQWDSALNRLMYSPQPMTDRIWKNIYPKLVPYLEQGRVHRLGEEAVARKTLRKKSITEYFTEFAQGEIAMDARLSRGTFLESHKLLELPGVVKILEATDSKFACRLLWTMNLEEVKRANRIHQEQLVSDLRRILNHNPDKPPAFSIPLDELEGPIESYYKISISDINFQSSLDIKELALATSAFYCPGSRCQKILWFPTVTEHQCCIRKPYSFGNRDKSWLGGRFIMGGLKGTRDLRPLILRLLRELGLASISTYSEAMALGDSCVCMRCDPLVAPMSTFDELVTHYATEHRWWASVDPAADDPDLFHNLPGNQPPEIIHTHDPSDESPLVSIVTPEQRETMLQNRAGDEPRRQALINSLDAAEPDTDATIFGELMDPSRFVDPIVMEDHIQTRHNKTPNLLVDSRRRCWDWN
ncbi:hypothetical protein FRC05_005872 [Tulasnella sp. 425]|nr:hypothetical protein FRC05_005872 [Tulasnella sp. 425]